MERTPAWERARSHSLRYARRDPTQRVLYRIVYHYRQELEYCWSERFEHKYGCLRDEVKQAFDDFLDCGILLHGCARAVCEQCHHSEIIPFSCKRKFICASCDAKRALLFGEHLHENVLLPYPQMHQVYSIPKILRPRLKFNRSLLHLLFHAAWNSWKQFIAEALPECNPAGVLALHSAGDLLHWHPHIHTITLNGGIDPHGVFQPLRSVDADLLTQHFARNMLDALLAAGEIESETATLIQSWEHSGFHVFSGEPIATDDAEARQFIGRYLKKSVVADSRLELITKPDNVIVRIHKNTVAQQAFRDLDPLTFLAELAAHVPARREQTVRYMGEYSARTRGAKRLALATPGPLQVSEPPGRPNPAWARCLAKVFELDPLVCPKCGGTMHIKAFIQDSQEITRLTTNLGIPAWRAPPPLPRSAPLAA